MHDLLQYLKVSYLGWDQGYILDPSIDSIECWLIREGFSTQTLATHVLFSCSRQPIQTNITSSCGWWLVMPRMCYPLGLSSGCLTIQFLGPEVIKVSAGEGREYKHPKLHLHDVYLHVHTMYTYMSTQCVLTCPQRHPWPQNPGHAQPLSTHPHWAGRLPSP